MDEKKDLRTGKAINMRKLIFAVIGVELVILLIIGTLGILIDKRSQPQDLDLGSWKSEFEKAGYEVVCVIRGLGEIGDIRELYVQHAEEAIQSMK